MIGIDMDRNRYDMESDGMERRRYAWSKKSLSGCGGIACTT